MGSQPISQSFLSSIYKIINSVHQLHSRQSPLSFISIYKLCSSIFQIIKNILIFFKTFILSISFILATFPLSLFTNYALEFPEIIKNILIFIKIFDLLLEESSNSIPKHLFTKGKNIFPLFTKAQHTSINFTLTTFLYICLYLQTMAINFQNYQKYPYFHQNF